MTLESKHEKAVAAYCKELGFLCWKLSSPANRAVPDRMIMAPKGRILFLELKAKGKKPTKLQERRLSQLRDKGFAAEWSDNIEDSKILIIKLL